MNTVLFSSRRRPYEFIVFAAALLSLVVYVFLDEYRFQPTTADHYMDVANRRIDSVAAAYGLDRDTLAVFGWLTVDEELNEALTDSLGVLGTQKHLQQHRLQEAQYEVQLSIPNPANMNLSFSNGNRTRSTDDDAEPESSRLRLLLDADADVVGVFVRRDSIDTDSTALFRLLTDQLPDSYPQSLVWALRKQDSDGSIVYTALLDSNALWSKRLRIAAERSETGAAWTIGWAEEVTVNRTRNGNADSDRHTAVVRALRLTFTILVFVVIFIMAGAFISRLRKKAVSITLSLISSAIVTLYLFVNVILFMELAFIFYLFVLLFYFILAFLLVGMPIAGTFSLIRERYADRFYTLLRLRREPWKSLYVGRSILMGMAAAFCTVTATTLVYFTAVHGGFGTAFDAMFFNYGLYFLAIQPPYALFTTMLFVPFVTVLPVLVFPALTARLSSERLRFWLSLGGAFLSMFLLMLSQSGEFPSAITGAIMSGVVGFLLLYFFDVLALVVFAIVSSALSLTPLLAPYPVFAAALAVLALAVAVVAVRSYLSPAEVVHEEEYKPLFVYKIEEEKRILQELAAAQSVQKRLLPSVLPQIENIRVAASCIPALEVGGDYYDFFRLDDHRLGVLIGDVSGKGMSAAFYITLAKGVIVSQIHQAGTPADVLRRVNSLVYGVMERGKFISLIYGILDTRTNEFTFANAGHNPLIVRRSAIGNRAEFVQTRGMAIGLDNGRIFDAVTTNHTLLLHQQDVLLLYTDGVSEAMNYDGEEYGNDRLQGTVEQSPAGADTVVSTLIASVRSFIGKAKQHDDITVVAVEILSSPHRALHAHS